jgi:diaminopimelate decarboxylase
MFAPHHCERKEKKQDGITIYTVIRQKKTTTTKRALVFLDQSIDICVPVCVYDRENHCTVVNRTTTNRSQLV